MPIRLLLLALLAASLTGCLRTGLQMLESSDSMATAIVAGDIRTVASGTAGAGDNLARVPPGVYEVAIGYGALEPGADPAAISQAIILGDVVFVRSVQVGDVGRLARGTEGLVTPFVVGLNASPVPSARYKIRGDVTLEDVVREIALRHGPDFYLCGVAEFDTAEGSGLTRAPILGDPVFGERRGMYFQEGLVEVNKPVFFAGCLGVSAERIVGGGRSVYHVEPGRETLVDEVGDIYGAILSTDEDVSPYDPATAAPHVTGLMRLKNQSVIDGGEVLVYTIEEFDVR